MDIKVSNINGKLLAVTDQEIDSLNLNFEIPILFTDIDSGPKGLNSVIIDKIQIDNFKIDPSTNTTFHPYENSKNSIRGEELRAPMSFKDTEGDNTNLLILFFSVTKITSELKEHLSSDGLKKIELLCSFNFINSRKLELKVEGDFTSLEQKRITLKSIKRTKSATLIKINLFLLIILIGSLSVWNFCLNRNVYLQEEYYTQEAITGFVAILGTFFGLSVLKIRKVFSALSNIETFFKFPEIHLSLVQFDNFSSKTWLRVLVICTLIAFWWVFKEYNINCVGKNFEYAIYDRVKEQYVNTEKYYRFYKKTLLDRKGENRFEIHKEKVDSAKIKAVSIGTLNPKKTDGFDEYKFNVTYNRNKLKTSKDTIATYFLKNKDDLYWGREIPFDDIFKKKEKDNQRKIGNLIVNYLFNGNKRAIEIIDIRNISEDEITKVINDFDKEIDIQKYDSENKIFKVRLNLIKELENRFENSFSESSVLSKKLILEITHTFIGKTNNGNKIKNVRHYIYLIALWNSFGQRIKVTSKEKKIDDSDLKKICDSIKKTLGDDTGWKRDRIIMSFILEVQKQIGSNKSEAIDFIDEYILCNSNCERLVNVWDFIISSSIAKTNDRFEVKTYVRCKIRPLLDKLIRKESYAVLDDFYKKYELYEKSKDRNKDFVHNDPGILASIESFITNINLHSNCK